MDPCFLDHMFPQELNAYIHQFHSIQGAASQVGRCCRMGCHSLEPVTDLIICQGTFKPGRIIVHGMPGQGCVQFIKNTITGHKRFSGTAFFTGTAKVDHRTGEISGFQICFDAYGRGNGARAQQIMPAAMTVSARHYRAFFRCA